MREPDAFTRAYDRLRVRLPQDRADDDLTTVIDVAAVELRAFYDELKARGRRQLALEHERDRYKAALDIAIEAMDVVSNESSYMPAPPLYDYYDRINAALEKK